MGTTTAMLHLSIKLLMDVTGVARYNTIQTTVAGFATVRNDKHGFATLYLTRPWVENGDRRIEIGVVRWFACISV